MGKVCRFREVRAVTAELTIEYLKPVLVDKDLVVEGYELEMKGRNLYLAGDIRDSSGQVLAWGKGRFVIVDAQRHAKQAAKDDAPEELAGKPLQQ
jgi:acyl-CoA thioesterase FadM